MSENNHLTIDLTDLDKFSLFATTFVLTLFVQLFDVEIVVQALVYRAQFFNFDKVGIICFPGYYTQIELAVNRN